MSFNITFKNAIFNIVGLGRLHSLSINVRLV